MNKKIIAAIAVVAILLAIVFLKDQFVGKENEVLEQISLEEALSNDRATMVEFRTDQCSVCRQIEPMITEIQKDYQDKANVLVINLSDEKNHKYLEQYSVRVVPTFAFFDAENKMLEFNGNTLLEGALADEQIRKVLSDLSMGN